MRSLRGSRPGVCMERVRGLRGRGNSMIQRAGMVETRGGGEALCPRTLDCPQTLAYPTVKDVFDERGYQ